MPAPTFKTIPSGHWDSNPARSGARRRHAARRRGIVHARRAPPYTSVATSASRWSAFNLSNGTLVHWKQIIAP
ncbi:protein of unknown function [Burkholderia multivorans]